MTKGAGKVDWERFSWLLAGVWIVFLVFPVSGVLGTDRPIGLKVLGLGLIAGFGAVYLLTFFRLPIWPVRPTQLPLRLAGLGGLLAAAIGVVAIVGPNGLGLAPFMVAYASFLLPPPWRLGVFAAVLAVVVTWSVALGELEMPLVLVPISLAIMVSAMVTSRLIQRDVGREALEKETAVVAERDRIARDVHDLLGHSLTVINLKTQLAARLLDSDPHRAKQELEAITAITQEALAGVRATVHDRRSGGFPQAVDDAVSALGDGEVSVQVSGDPHLVTGRVVLPLAWLVREAATNILRHASASRCRVAIEPGRVVVEDDGVGLGGRREGTGLSGMRERLALVGGTLHTGRSVWGGTRLEARW